MSQPANRRPPPLPIAITVLVLVNVLWGTSFSIMQGLGGALSAAAGTGPRSSLSAVEVAATMIATRFVLATVVLAVMAPRFFFGAWRAEWLAGGLMGIAFSAGLICQVVGLGSIPVSLSAFLTSLFTIFTPLLVWLISGRRPARTVAAGLLLSAAGVAVLSGIFGSTAEASTPRQVSAFGVAATTLGAFFFSVQIIVVDYYGRRLRSAYLTQGMFVATAVIGLTLAVSLSYLSGSSPGPGHYWLATVSDPAAALCFVLLSVFCTVIAFAGMNTCQPAITASQAAVIYSSEPIFASLWAMFLPGLLAVHLPPGFANERFTLQLIAGGGLVLAGNILALRQGEERGG